MAARHRRATPGWAVALGATLTAALGACNSTGAVRTEAAYCAAARAQRDALSLPPTDLATADKVLAAYHAVRAAAPLAIEPEWGVLERLVDTAVHVDPTQPEELAKVAAAARRAKRTAQRVILYTKQTCDVLIGDIDVVPDPGVVPPTLDGAATRRAASTPPPQRRPTTTAPAPGPSPASVVSSAPGEPPAGGLPDVTTDD